MSNNASIKFLVLKLDTAYKNRIEDFKDIAMDMFGFESFNKLLFIEAYNDCCDNFLVDQSAYDTVDLTKCFEVNGDKIEVIEDELHTMATHCIEGLILQQIYAIIVNDDAFNYPNIDWLEYARYLSKNISELALWSKPNTRDGNVNLLFDIDMSYLTHITNEFNPDILDKSDFNVGLLLGKNGIN